MAIPKISFKSTIWWNAPAYFDRWRVFPRAFMCVYWYLLVEVVFWFMSLPNPTTEQAGLVSIIVGMGSAFFSIYTKEPAKQLDKDTNVE